MTCIGKMRRVTCVLLLLLSCLSFGRVTAQNAVPRALPVSVKITGTVEVPSANLKPSLELPGVILKGFRGNLITDAFGEYEISVEKGWSGTVIPVREGYTFEPPKYEFKNVTRDLIVSFVAKRIEWEISGSVGVADVRLTGLPGNPVISDSSGSYRITLADGYSGRVTPVKEGFVFDPPTRRYDNLSRDEENQDYLGTVLTIKVSGSTGVVGVSLEGFPEQVFSGRSGRYETRVPYGWSGAVMLRKDGVKFRPPGRPYNSVKRDFTDHDYIPETPPAIPRQIPSQSKIMVVPTEEVRPDQLTAISEDLGVMLHLLKQKTAENRSERASVVFSDFGDFFKAQRPAFEALYLQGHGVLFFLEAQFDLASTPEPDLEPSSADVAHVDPVWQSARRAMLTPKGASPQAVPPSTQLSADELAAAIIPTLKHAANIRFLGPPETITIRVLKKDPAMAARGFAMYGGGGTMMMNMDETYGGYAGGGGAYGAAGGGFVGSGQAGSEYGTESQPQEARSSSANRRARSDLDTLSRIVGVRTSPSPAANALTLHVLKSDVDDFAQGKIPLEEFKRRVKVLKYQSSQLREPEIDVFYRP